MSLTVWIAVIRGLRNCDLTPAQMRALIKDLIGASVRLTALAEIVRQSAEWSGPDTGLCWDIVPNSNPCTHPGCIERRALIGEGAA